MGSNLAFSLKEDPVRCAKVCDKSWVILTFHLLQKVYNNGLLWLWWICYKYFHRTTQSHWMTTRLDGEIVQAQHLDHPLFRQSNWHMFSHWCIPLVNHAWHNQYPRTLCQLICHRKLKDLQCRHHKHLWTKNQRFVRFGPWVKIFQAVLSLAQTKAQRVTLKQLLKKSTLCVMKNMSLFQLCFVTWYIVTVIKICLA